MDTKQKIEHVQRMIRVTEGAIATYRKRNRKVNEAYEREVLKQLLEDLAELKAEKEG